LDKVISMKYLTSPIIIPATVVLLVVIVAIFHFYG